LFSGRFRISNYLYPNSCSNLLSEFIMRIPKHPTLIRSMLNARLAELTTDKPILAASLVLVSKHCGRAGCHCQQGGPLHTAHHLTFKVKGKSKTVYVPHDLLDDVRSWVAEHKRLKALQAEINQLTLALIKGHAQHQKRKKGRS
jgi:hypothetical protein